MPNTDPANGGYSTEQVQAMLAGKQQPKSAPTAAPTATPASGYSTEQVKALLQGAKLSQPQGYTTQQLIQDKQSRDDHEKNQVKTTDQTIRTHIQNGQSPSVPKTWAQLNTQEPGPGQLINRFENSAAGKATNSAMDTFGNVLQSASEFGNRELRNSAQGYGIGLGNTGSPTDQAVGKIWHSSQLSWGQKIDQTSQILGINSTNELKFWSDPKLYNQILTSVPKTLSGNIMKRILLWHAGNARWKQGHPLFTSGETVALGYADPTQWILGMPLKALGAAGHAAGEAAAAAHAEAAAEGAERAAEGTEEGSAAAKAATKAREAANKAAANKRNPLVKVGSDFGKAHPEPVRKLGNAYHALTQKVHGVQGALDRYHNMEHEYGTQGAWVHHDMVIDHSRRTNATRNLLESTDYGGGMSSKTLDVFSGTDPKQMNDMQQIRHIVEHQNDIKAGGLNPKAQEQLEGLHQQLQELESSPIDPTKNETPELRQGKIQHVQQQIAYINKTQRVELPPDVHVPNNGVSKMQRADNITKHIGDRFKTAKKKFPITAKHLMGPEVYGYDAETGVPQSVTTFWPHQSTYDLEGIEKGAGGRAGRSSSPVLMRRTRGKVSEATTQEPDMLDIHGNPSGKPGRPALKISKNDNPLGDLLTRLQSWDNYEAMIDHAHNGRWLISQRDGKSATMPVYYTWPGDPQLRDIEIELNGQKVPLDRPYKLGAGPNGAKNAKNFAKEVAPYRIKQKSLNNHSDIDYEATKQDIYNELTGAFRKANPNHLDPEPYLHTPDLEGYAIHHTYLDAIADANPVFRWKGKAAAIGERTHNALQKVAKTQDETRWDQATMGGVSPKDFDETHFSGEDDNTVNRLLKAYDTVSSAGQMAVLYNFMVHPMINTLPAMAGLLLEHAGQNPLKILKYGHGLIGATLGATIKAADELTFGSLGDVNDLIKEKFGPLGGGIQKAASLLNVDVEPKWLKAAEKYGVNVPHGIRSMGMSMADHARIFTTPFKDLPLHDQFMRMVSSGAQWNQHLTFDVMESRMLGQTFKHLVEDEKIQPEVAARKINKAINDYGNVSKLESSPVFQRMTWFWNFFRMQLRRNAALLMKNPKFFTSQALGVQTWNQMQGQQTAVGKDSQGNPRLGIVSSAPYKYGTLLGNLVLGLVPGANGDEGSAAKAAASSAVGHTSPLGDLTARGIAQIFNVRNNNSTAPNRYNSASGLADTALPLGDELKQAGGMLLSKFTPGFAEPAYVNYTKPQMRMIYQAQDDMRSILKNDTATPLEKKTASDLLMTLDDLDNKEVLQAVIKAQAIYSQFHGKEHYRKRSAWL